MSSEQGVSIAQRARNTEMPSSRRFGLMKGLAVLVLFVQFAMNAGCGTLFERSEMPRMGRGDNYYIGVQYDWRLLTFESYGSYDYRSMFCYLSVVCPFVTLLSMPVDFVVDTVMLYSDHQNKLVEERGFNGYLRGKYCTDEGGPDEVALRKLGLDVSFCLKASN